MVASANTMTIDRTANMKARNLAQHPHIHVIKGKGLKLLRTCRQWAILQA
jgi:hypothetical protein